jgi:hypothetical protein
MPKRQQLRCFCGTRPLLGLYGFENGRLFVHVKVYKADRVYGEVVAWGDLKLRCRNCLRWHTVVIRQPDRVAALEETEPPDTEDMVV